MELNKLYQPEVRSIYTFKPGEYLIRPEPTVIKNTVHNDNLNIDIDIVHFIDNHTCRKHPKEFVCIENGLIYMRQIVAVVPGFKLSIEKLILKDFEEGWSLFKIPDGLTIEDCM